MGGTFSHEEPDELNRDMVRRLNILRNQGVKNVHLPPELIQQVGSQLNANDAYSAVRMNRNAYNAYGSVAKEKGLAELKPLQLDLLRWIIDPLNLQEFEIGGINQIILRVKIIYFDANKYPTSLFSLEIPRALLPAKYATLANTRPLNVLLFAIKTSPEANDNLVHDGLYSIIDRMMGKGVSYSDVLKFWYSIPLPDDSRTHRRLGIVDFLLQKHLFATMYPGKTFHPESRDRPLVDLLEKRFSYEQMRRWISTGDLNMDHLDTITGAAKVNY